MRFCRLGGQAVYPIQLLGVLDDIPAPPEGDWQRPIVNREHTDSCPILWLDKDFCRLV